MGKVIEQVMMILLGGLALVLLLAAWGTLLTEAWLCVSTWWVDRQYDKRKARQRNARLH